MTNIVLSVVPSEMPTVMSESIPEFGWDLLIARVMIMVPRGSITPRGTSRSFQFQL